jgi:hypothetical protein
VLGAAAGDHLLGGLEQLQPRVWNRLGHQVSLCPA